MAGGEVRLTHTRGDFIQALLDRIEQAGAEVTQPDATTLRVRGGGRLRLGLGRGSGCWLGLGGPGTSTRS